MSSKFADLGFEPVETVDAFDTAFKRTLGFEGGNTIDHAGPTNLGITQDTFNNWRKKQGLPAKSVREINQEEAKQLYKQEYFEKPGFSKLPANIAGVLFDYGVNAGTPRAAMALQKAVGASPDGVIGPKTLIKVNEFVNRNGEKPLLQKIVDDRSTHNNKLINSNPSKFKKFSNGWNNRINAIKSEFKLSDLNPLSVTDASADEIPQNNFSDLGFEETAPQTTKETDFSDLGFELAKPVDNSLRDLLAEDVRQFKTPDEPIAENAIKEVLAAGERYPQGIMKTIENAQTGQGSLNPIENIFTPNPDKRDATNIAQDIGKRVLPEAVIKDPNNHLEYLTTLGKEFIKNLPFTTAGVVSEFANPVNTLIGGAIAKTPPVNIPAPKFIDDAIKSFIDFSGGPFTALNDAAKTKLTNSIVDEIYTKVKPRIGELKQNFKEIYGREATDADIKTQIKSKLDQAGIEKKNVIQLTEKLISSKMKEPLSPKVDEPLRVESNVGDKSVEVIKPSLKPISPIERAAKHGEVVGIDAKSGLPVIDTSVKPIIENKAYSGTDRRNADLIPPSKAPKNRLSDWTPLLNAYDDAGKRYQIARLPVSNTIKGKLLDHYGLLFDKPVVAAQTSTPTTLPKQEEALAPSTDNISNIQGGDSNGKSQEGQNGQEKVLKSSDVSTPSAAPDTANAGKAPTFISDNDISNFIKSPVIPNVKSKYDVKPEDQKTIVEKASNFISKFMGFTKQNPIVSSVGHKIFFAPDERSIARVGEKEGIIEYALHSLTKKGDPKNTDLRVTDNSKMRNIDNLEGILRNPDGYYLENNKVNYYKKISDDKRGYAVAVLENTKDGLRVSDEPLRYVTQLPDRKFVQISNKSTTQATSPDLGSVQKIVRVDEAPPLLDNKNIPQNKNIVKGKGDPASLKPPTVSQIKAAASPQDLEKRIEQLNKFGQANAILRRTATLKKAAGRYDPKANTVKIDEETITSNSSYMEVLGHELGHAIEKNVTGKIQQITSGKKGFELFGEKVDQAKIRAELEAVTEDLVGKARMDDKPEYFYQSTELIARFFEKMIFSHGNLTDLAPTAVNAIELQAIKHPIIQEFLLAATGGIDKGTPKFALLRDMRETYQKHLGKFVGNRAYDQEMVYRAMKERGKIVLEKFINDKMKMIKDSPENLFRAAESIKISRGGKPEFGTRDFAVAKTPEEERDLILAGYEKTPMPVLENGTAYPQYAKQRYTPEEGKQIFDSLSENGKKLIVDFTAERREAKDFFNREVIKETYKIKSQLEGWVHHYFDDRPGSTVMGGQKFKQKIAGARKQRTGTEGYVEDFKKAMTKALVDLEGERVFNEFIPKMLAMVTKPLGQGQTPDPGWIEVVGNIKTGVGLPIEKRATIIDSVTGERVPMKQSRYQMPKEIYERYKLWRGLIDEASTAVRVVNDLNRYWRINILTHPGTSATNFISGGLQFSSKILTDFYREVLTGKLSMPDTQANISAMVKVLLPKGWMDAPDWVYGSDLSNFYGEFMKKKSPISTSIDTYGNKALYMFGAVERYWKKVIMTADGVADLKSLNQMTPEGLRIPTKEEAEMIAAINESVDLYGYDYDNVPQWLEQHQKSVVGQAIKPFAKYPYKYAKQILGMVGEAFDQSKPWQDRVAKVLALATIVSAYAAFSNDRKKKQKTPVADKSLDIPPRLSTRGRVFITTDEKGRELFVRVAKYPFLNLTEAGMQFVDGNWSTGVDVLSDMLGSIGPAAAVGLMAFNYRSKYNQYEKPEVILGDNLATFLPGYRILNDVSRALDPFQRKQETFGQTFTQIIPTTDQALQEKLHGKIRTERVPIEGDVGLEPVGSRTTVDVNLENVKEDILLSLFTGVYRTRLDPTVVEAYIIRKQKNLDKKKAKE